MKISVVVPTYKRPELLSRCLQALDVQIFPKNDFEIIVVSDGPDERTSALIRRMANPKIVFAPLAQKKGPAAARNAGWRSAKAKLIAFTDDDCIPDPKWLLGMWGAFLRTAGSKVAFTGRTIVPISKDPTDYERNIAHLQTAEFITANCACTKAALEKVGGFDENFTMAWREDSDLQFRFMMANIPIVPVSNAIVAHPVRKAKWGVSIKEEKKGIFNALLFKKFPGLYRKKIEPHPPWHYYSILSFLIVTIVGLLVNFPWLTFTGIAGWLICTVRFIFKRLQNTSRSLTHVTEMVVTSIVIPVLSVYYRIYGAWKYKTPLFP